MRKYIFAILLTILTNIYATDNENNIFIKYGLDDSEISKLIKDKSITYYLSKNDELKIFPEGQLKNITLREISDFDFSTGVETIFLIEKEGLDLPENQDLFFYNILRSVSTFKGTQYYSESKKRIRTLFTESYMVKSRADSKRLPDPVVETIPSISTITVFQEDTTFKGNFYQFTYRNSGEGSFLKMTNLNDLDYGILTLVKEDNMKMYINIEHNDKYIIMYGSCLLKTPGVSFLEERAHKSFYNRIIAMNNWFKGRLPAKSDS